MKDLWTNYRKDMIQRAGIVILLFGNKLVDGKIQPSGGMREEFEIAKDFGAFLLPVGATGYIAEDLWKEVIATFDEKKYAKGAEIHQKLALIGDASAPLADIRKHVVDIIALLKN